MPVRAALSPPGNGVGVMNIESIRGTAGDIGGLCRARVIVLAVMSATAFAAVSLPAQAGGADPERGVIGVIDRTAIEMSGLTTLAQLLSDRSRFNVFGIRGLSAAIGGSYLVDGRPPARLDFSAYPLSAVERIEILEDGVARYRGHTGDGTINIVLRRDDDGAEVSAGVGRPNLEGLDSNAGSALWSGEFARGRMLVGIDHAFREEVREADRDYTKAKYTDSFADSQGVSIAGNTLILGDDRHVLGDCDPSVYTGPLDSRSGQVCGFPYAEIAWFGEFPRTNRESLFLYTEHPLKEGGEIYLDALVARTNTRLVWAPPTEQFKFDAPSGSAVRTALEAEGFTIPSDDEVTIWHRFVGHGNRDWRWTWNDRSLSLGIRGDLADNLGYDVHIRHYRDHGIEKASTFVSEDLVKAAIESGEYDIVDPLSPDRNHLAAIRNSAVTKHRDLFQQSDTIRAALDGKTLTLPGEPVRWTAAVQLQDYDIRDVVDHRDSEGRSHEATAVFGGSGSNVVAKRQIRSADVGAVVPLSPVWDVILTGGFDDYNDIGTLVNWRVANRYAPIDAFTLRAYSESWESSPSTRQLYESTSKNFPFVRDCKGVSDDDCGDVEVLQVTNEIAGNPNLKPSEWRQVGVGATLRFGVTHFAVDWYRGRTWNRPSRPGAQSLVDLESDGKSLPEGAQVVRVGGGTGDIEKLVTPLFNRRNNDSLSEGVAFRAGTAWETDWATLELDLNVFRAIRSESRVAGIKQPGDFPRYRRHIALRASRGDVTASWNFHAESGYWNSTRTGRWESWTGHDLALQWRNAFGRDGLKLTGGVLNVGDREPAQNPANPNAPALTYESVRGRTLFLSTAFTW